MVAADLSQSTAMTARSLPRSADAGGQDGDRARTDRALFARQRSGAASLDREVLFRRFLPLARKLASGYRHGGEPPEDIMQVACLGLLKAIDRYDPGRGCGFSSYALPTIRGEIRRHFRDHTWPLHVHREMQELSQRVDRAITDLAAQLRQQPTVAQLAAHLDIGEEQVLDAIAARDAYRPASLDAPLGASDDDAAEDVSDALGGEDPGFATAEHRAIIDSLTHVLSPRDRIVLRLRFEHELTQAEIARRIGRSQMQVSRIVRQAINRLRDAAEPDQGSHEAIAPVDTADRTPGLASPHR
jgi:RNA polymerase sigma-B factor